MFDEGLRVELLGTVRAWHGARSVSLGPARQRAVFTVLAVRAGRPVTRDELVSAVWGEQAPASVDGSVHTYISGLRRALEPDRGRWTESTVLTSAPAGYTLRVAPEQVDAVAFERVITQARTAPTGPSVAELDKAVQLWQGGALSGIPGPFADRERARLAELRLSALELRAEALLAEGGHAELAAELTALVDEHPLRERFRELLMLALYRGGRHAEALTVFRDGRAKLVEELGVEPGATLQRLHTQILAQDTALDAPPPTTPTPPPALPAAKPDRLFVLPALIAPRLAVRVRSVFVGRTEELGRLRTLVDSVCAGRGGAAWVEGEFGVGKSELLTNALFDIAERDCQVGWAMADELSGRVPLQVMYGCLGLDRADGGLLGDVAAELSGQLGTVGLRSGQDTALATVGRLLSVVHELCARAPLILVADDMQWADEASVLLWHRLVAATRQLPLLLIAATRPLPRRGQHARLRQAVGSRGGEILTLDPLTGEEALELQEQLIGARPGPELRDLVERTIGNPLYITELTEALVRERALRTEADTVDLADSSTYSAPRSLVDTIARHLEVLSDEAWQTLRWAALLGVEFAVTDIAAVTEKRPSDLVPIFEEAVAANVIVDSDTHLAFRHPLLRQACYEAIPAGTRSGLHRQTAEALAAIGAPVTRVAEQLAAAHSPDSWMRQWLADNHQAVANRAPVIAADLLRHAVDACRDDDPNRETLAAALARVLLRLGRRPEAWAHGSAVPSQRGSLSTIEIDIARLAAGGLTNPEIADRLSLPRGTVQAHMARLLGALSPIEEVAGGREPR